MNTSTAAPYLFALLTLCSLAGCATTTRDAADSALGIHHPTAAELGHCPFGHSHLKDIPIAYGLMAPNPEFERQCRDLDAWYGGCVIGPDSPSSKVVCPDCRYAYDSMKRVWSKSSSDRAAFARPLSKLVADLPVPAGAHVTYYQDVIAAAAPADPPAVTTASEQIIFYAPAKLDLASVINAHVQQDCPMRLEGRASQYPAGTSICVRGIRDGNNGTGIPGDGRVVKYNIEYRHDKGQATVHFIATLPAYDFKWFNEGEEEAKK